MSNAYTNRVWKQKELKGGKLLVMLALAGHADDAGECWPGMALLIEKTRLTDRQLRRVLNELAAANLITIEERAIGRGKRPHYKLFPAEKADIMTEEKRTLLPPLEIKADISDNKSGHFVHGKADISDADYSHVRSESPIEPKQELKGESAPARIESPEPTSKTLRVKSRHLDPRHFVGGYIPAGTGANPIEVYYERFSINHDAARLNVIKEDDLTRLCPDLDKLRDVVIAYSRTTFQPGNVQLILDWYEHGVPDKHKVPGGNGARATLNDSEKSAILTRAKTAAASKRTAEKFGGPINPQWELDIQAARSLGL